MTDKRTRAELLAQIKDEIQLRDFLIRQLGIAEKQIALWRNRAEWLAGKTDDEPHWLDIDD